MGAGIRREREAAQAELRRQCKHHETYLSSYSTVPRVVCRRCFVPVIVLTPDAFGEWITRAAGPLLFALFWAQVAQAALLGRLLCREEDFDWQDALWGLR